MARPKVALNRDPFIWIMIGLYLVSIFGMIATFITILWKVDTGDRIGQIFVVRMLQVTLGMVIGSTMTFLGMVTAWFGLSDEMSGEGEAKEFRLKLAAASPGALLIITGTILIFICVTKEVSYSQNGGVPQFENLPDPVVQVEPTNRVRTAFAGRPPHTT
jgi:hypothetical protein